MKKKLGGRTDENDKKKKKQKRVSYKENLNLNIINIV